VSVNQGRKNYRRPIICWTGISLILFFWSCNWLLPGLRTHWAFFPMWLGYCLFVSSLVILRTRSSLLTRNYRAYVGLFLISIPIWWLFEFINWHTQNWFYQGEEYFSKREFFLLSSLSFSVVIPAVFGTAELVSTFSWVQRLKTGPCFTLHSLTGPILLGIGLLMILLIALWPQYYFPLVWGSLYLIVDSINLKLGYRTLLAHISQGDWRQVVSLGLGSLICGFFWELWNFYSYPKWIYHIPYVDFMHVFEMPLLGYLGYVPFALELFALYHFAIGIIRKSWLNDYVLEASDQCYQKQQLRDNPDINSSSHRSPQKCKPFHNWIILFLP